ncbi:MAG: GAF domain-containing sensor histidine kinase [Chloroflexi bacterium]|nr:GAF domain-containing sensor histidine kinase [Chloroflexota bacterium]
MSHEYLGYAEEILVLRHRIWSRLREQAGVLPASAESIAACLNLVTDVEKLRALDARLDQVEGDGDVLEFIADALRDTVQARPAIERSHLPPSPFTPEAIQHLVDEEDVDVLRRRLRQALILISEGCALLTSTDKSLILKRAVRAACQLVRGSAGLAFELENGTCVDVATCGMGQEVDVLPAAIEELMLVLDAHCPELVDDISRFPAFIRCSPSFEDVHCVMTAPLWRDGMPVGFLLVGVKQADQVGQEDLDMLAALARQVSFALENLTLHTKVQELGRLEERQRIAQDLHDTVVQLLFVIGMEAETLLRMLPQDSEAYQKALRIRRVTSRASTELRSAIAALRSRPLTGENTLAEALQEMADEFERLSNIEVTLIVPSRWPHLSAQAASATYRIIREALMNVQKHAHATAAVVSVSVRADRLVVTVQDNGVGFRVEPYTLLDGDMNFGLPTMHRLAEAVGGYLELLNGEDGGAVVRFVLPLESLGDE